MSQSKGMSLLEAVVNTVVGLGVAMVRSYLLRRLFNAQWRPRLQAWWIVRRSGVMRFIDSMAQAYEKYGRGRRF